MAVPHNTALLPPAFSAIFPPMVQAQGRGRVGGEYQISRCGRLHGGVGDDAGAQFDGRYVEALPAGRHKGLRLDGADMVKLLGIDDDTAFGHRDRPAREPGPAPPGDRFEAQFRDGPEELGHLVFFIGTDHGNRQVQPPVGGIGGMGHECKGVEENILVADNGTEMAADAAPRLGDGRQIFVQGVELPAAFVEHQVQVRFFNAPLGDERQIPPGRAQKPPSPVAVVDHLLE